MESINIIDIYFILLCVGLILVYSGINHEVMELKKEIKELRKQLNLFLKDGNNGRAVCHVLPRLFEARKKERGAKWDIMLVGIAFVRDTVKQQRSSTARPLGFM